MALLLAFAAGGVFLVFFILVLIDNVTVTQRLINGLFYANIASMGLQNNTLSLRNTRESLACTSSFCCLAQLGSWN